MLRNYILVIGCILFGFSLSAYSQTRSGPKIKTIIVDAGHGGTDAGARGSYSTEAQITLELSKRVDQLLREELPDTKILMTRTTDVFHNVREKANFANENNGDLFVCIHVDARPPIKHREFLHYKTVTYYTGKGKNRKKRTRKQAVYKYWTTPNPTIGTATYVFAADRGDEKASGILEDERFESTAEVEDVPDPTSPEAIIKARLWSQKFFKNSVKLATLIENEFAAIGRNSRGVLQRNEKGIWVLQATNMPAVLIETGMITNKEEEDFLNSDPGQEKMARAIATAVIAYKTMVDGPPSATKKSEATPINTSNLTKENPPAKKEDDNNRQPKAVMTGQGSKKK